MPGFEGGPGVGAPDDGLGLRRFVGSDGAHEKAPGPVVVFLFVDEFDPEPGEDVAGDLGLRVVAHEVLEFALEFSGLLESVVREGEMEGGFPAEGLGSTVAGFPEVGEALGKPVEAEEGPSDPEVRGGLLGLAATGKVREEVAVAVNELRELFGVLVEFRFFGPGILQQGAVGGGEDEALEIAQGLCGLTICEVGVGALDQDVGAARVVGMLFEELGEGGNRPGVVAGLKAGGGKAVADANVVPGVDSGEVDGGVGVGGFVVGLGLEVGFGEHEPGIVDPGIIRVLRAVMIEEFGGPGGEVLVLGIVGAGEQHVGGLIAGFALGRQAFEFLVERHGRLALTEGFIGLDGEMNAADFLFLSEGVVALFVEGDDALELFAAVGAAHEGELCFTAPLVEAGGGEDFLEVGLGESGLLEVAGEEGSLEGGVGAGFFVG